MVGNFPVGWTEWNGEYRDAARGFWANRPVPTELFAHRLTGSGDLYERTGRRPYASVNFVACHDGYTLRDLVSYETKHNEANGEDNRDGSNENHNWNCGHEGPTDDPTVTARRNRQRRNLLATVLLSQGVPMILAGDEIGHTQRGNNNTYCQDGPLTWLDWAGADREFLAFAQAVARLRAEEPVLRRRTFFQGRAIRGADVADVSWFKPDGRELANGEWAQAHTCFGMRLAGDLIRETDEFAEPVVGDTLLALFNAGDAAVPFVLPATNAEHEWELLLDTTDDLKPHATVPGGARYDLTDHALALFRTRRVKEHVPLSPHQTTALRRAVANVRSRPLNGAGGQS
jgi:glycogen operon protein